jgi:ribonuclease III
MNRSDFTYLEEQREEIEKILGLTFLRPELLFLAFVHRSFVHENQDMICEHNERLEFLGDSVLGLIMAEYLYNEMPKAPEGTLSHLRARLVEATTCMQFLQKLGLEKYILLGKGEAQTAGRGKKAIYSDVFEAILGAIYLDQGFMACQKFIHEHFASLIHQIINMPSSNYKAMLQDYAQKKAQTQPLYEVEEVVGPDHAKTFTVVVSFQGKKWAHGKGASKKEAEQMAAKNALEILGLIE